MSLTHDIADARRRLHALRGGGPPTAPGEWQSRAVRARDGVSFKGCLANAVLVLEHDIALVGRIRYDAFRDRIVAHNLPWSRDDHEWTDEDTGELRIWFHRYENRYGMDVGRSDVDTAVACVAHHNEFHPLRDWLSGLAWDGVARLDRLWIDYFGAADTPYARGVAARWAISAVARAFEPGCQVDYAPVLEGAQGLGKSTGLEALVGKEWFFNSGIDLTNLKSAYETIQGKWVVELGELDALSKADITRVKAFLTSQQDHFRAAYARHAVTHPRQVVFVGSTNEDRYLKDATGNRRFWPVACGTIDRDAIRRDREQLWAEAVVRYHAGEAWRPDTALSRLAMEEQEHRYQDDAWEEPVATWLGPRDGVSTYEVLVGALAVEKGRITRGDEMRCASVLRRIGLTDIRREQERGVRARRYYRGEPYRPDGRAPIQSSNQTPVPSGQPDQPSNREQSNGSVNPMAYGEYGGTGVHHGQMATLASQAADDPTDGFGEWLSDMGVGTPSSEEPDNDD